MSTFSGSRVSRLLFANPALGRVVGVTARRWGRLAAPPRLPRREVARLTERGAGGLTVLAIR